MSKKTKKRWSDKKIILREGDVVTLLSSQETDVLSPYMTVEASSATLVDVVWFSSDDKLNRATIEPHLLTKIVVK